MNKKKKDKFSPYTNKDRLDAYEKRFGIKPDFVVTDRDGLREGWIQKLLPKYWNQFQRIIYISTPLAEYIHKNSISESRLVDMYNNYAEWVNNIQPYLPDPLENDKVMSEIFVYHLNGKKVWAERWHTEDYKDSTTFMFPEDR